MLSSDYFLFQQILSLFKVIKCILSSDDCNLDTKIKFSIAVWYLFHEQIVLNAVLQDKSNPLKIFRYIAHLDAEKRVNKRPL